MTNLVAEDARLAVECREEAEAHMHGGRLYRMLRAAADAIERLQDSPAEPTGNTGDFEYAFEQRRRKMADWWDLTEEQRKFYRNGFEEGFWSGIATEPPAKCTCQPLAQQQRIGMRVVAVDPECPVHRKPSPVLPCKHCGSTGELHYMTCPTWDAVNRT